MFRHGDGISDPQVGELSMGRHQLCGISANFKLETFELPDPHTGRLASQKAYLRAGSAAVADSADPSAPGNRRPNRPIRASVHEGASRKSRSMAR